MVLRMVAEKVAAADHRVECSLTTGNVLAVDEERGLHSLGREVVRELRRALARAVVERESERVIRELAADELVLADDLVVAGPFAERRGRGVVRSVVGLRGAAGERAARGEGGGEHQSRETTGEHSLTRCTHCTT